MLTWKINAFGESYSPEINKDTFEKVPSKVVFDRFLRKDLEANHVLYIVVGSDSGLLAHYVNEQFKLTGSCFIFIDLPEVVEKFQDLFLIKDSESPLKSKKKKRGGIEHKAAPFIQFMTQGEALSTVIREVGGYDEYLLRRQISVIKSMAVLEKNYADYQAMFTDYERQLISLQMSNNSSSVRRFMNAMLRDVSDMIYPVKIMKDYYQGKTFVLLGGAPSLPKIFPWLKEHRRDVVVLAASRIAGRLKQEHIVPDYFVAVDPDPEMLDYSRDLFEFADKSVLITSNHLAPNVMGQWAGRNLYMRNRFSFKEVPEEEQGNLPGSGPTVMNSAIMLAGYMGAKQIILSGVDFCYDPSGQSHESSSLESKIGRYFRYGGHQVETYSGLMAETDAQMLAASRGLHDQVAWLLETMPEITILNINPFATKVEGIELTDASTLISPDPISSEIREGAWQLTEVSTKSYRKLIEQQVIKVVDKHKKRLDKVVQFSKKGIQLTLLMHNTQDPRFSVWVRDIKKYRLDVEKTLGEDLFMLFDYAYFDYVKLIEPLNDAHQTLEQTLATMKAYFSAVEKSSVEFIAQLMEVRKTALWRLKECDCQLSSELVEYWIDQQLPGRFQAWLSRCDSVVLNVDEQALIAKAEQAFQELLSEKVPSFKAYYENTHQQLTSLWSHAKAAIQAKECERVKDISDYLKGINNEEFQQLAHYLDAFLAKEKEDWSSLDQSLAVITHERLVVPALQIKLDAALMRKDVAMILHTLEDLSVYDAYYLYLFAKVAPLLGQAHLTIPAFIHYLRARPKDSLALWDFWSWLQQHDEREHMHDLIEFIHHFELNEPELLSQIEGYLVKN